MLTLEALSATRDLVAVLADKGVSLTLHPDSELCDAMAATKTWGTKLNNLAEIDKLPGQLAELNGLCISEGVVDEHIHDAWMSDSSQRCGKILSAEVAEANTLVLPAVAELRSILDTALDVESTCGVRSYNVQMVTGSSLLGVAALVSRIEEVAGGAQSRELPLVLDFLPLSDEELVALLKIGSPDHDEAVDLFVSEAGMDTLREVWDVVFTNNRRGFTSFDQFRADPKKGLSRVYAAFLFASKIADGGELPDTDGSSGLSAGRLKQTVYGFKEVAAVAINAQLAQQRQLEQLGKLIDRVEGKTVFVNKTVYDRFMSEGGDIETILGAALTGPKRFILRDIAEDVEALKKSWTFHVALAEKEARDSAVIIARYAIDGFVSAFVRDTQDAEVKARAADIVSRSTDWVKGVTSLSLKDLDQLSLRAVSEIIFRHTHAWCILNGVTEAMTSNPEITKEDALLASVTAFAADWIAEQILIEE